MRSWWEIIGPDMWAELKDVQEKIKAELNPAQREKFQQLLRERRHLPGAVQGDRRSRDHRPPGTRTPGRPATDAPAGESAFPPSPQGTNPPR
jgi:hypothetical protein